MARYKQEDQERYEAEIKDLQDQLQEYEDELKNMGEQNTQLQQQLNNAGNKTPASVAREGSKMSRKGSNKAFDEGHENINELNTNVQSKAAIYSDMSENPNQHYQEMINLRKKLRKEEDNRRLFTDQARKKDEELKRVLAELEQLKGNQIEESEQAKR